MYHPIAPSVQRWYQDADKDEIFKVVAQNIDEDFIEIQYFSGEIAELDLETWFSLHLKTIPTPEDSSGPFELSQEELGYDSEGHSSQNRADLLSYLEPYQNYDVYDQYYRYDKYDKYWDNFDRTHFFEDND